MILRGKKNQSQIEVDNGNIRYKRWQKLLSKIPSWKLWADFVRIYTTKDPKQRSNPRSLYQNLYRDTIVASFDYYLCKNVQNKQCDGIDLLKYQRNNPNLPLGSAFSSCCCSGCTLALAGALVGARRAMLEVAFALGRIQLVLPWKRSETKWLLRWCFLSNLHHVGIDCALLPCFEILLCVLKFELCALQLLRHILNVFTG
jgi:hypothetical protein